MDWKCANLMESHSFWNWSRISPSRERGVMILVNCNVCVDFWGVFRSGYFNRPVFVWSKDEFWIGAIKDSFISIVVLYLMLSDWMFSIFLVIFVSIYNLSVSVPYLYFYNYLQKVFLKGWFIWRTFIILLLYFWRILVSCLLEIIGFVWDASQLRSDNNQFFMLSVKFLIRLLKICQDWFKFGRWINGGFRIREIFSLELDCVFVEEYMIRNKVYGVSYCWWRLRSFWKFFWFVVNQLVA